MLKFPLAAGAIAAVALTTLSPQAAQACACGCGAFIVGAGAMLPGDSRGALYLDYDFMNQSRNWSGGSSAPADNNDDKDIRTSFITVGAQYRIGRTWVLGAALPVWNRSFRTTTDTGVQTFEHTALADARLTATWTGLSKDMSLGLIAGVKLPTGDHSYANFDPDTEISSGSTDLLLGAYKRGTLNRDGTFTYFVHGLWQKPVDWRSNYRPGEEINLAAGLAWAGWSFSETTSLSPVLQLVGSSRARDHGPDGHPGDSGYDRLLLAPGLELQTDKWRVFAQVSVPVYQRVNGNQLTAPVLFKAVLTRAF